MFKVLNVLSALRAGFSFLCEKMQSGKHNCRPCCRKDVSGARNMKNSHRRGSSAFWDRERSASHNPSGSSAEAPGVATAADVAKHVWFTQGTCASTLQQRQMNCWTPPKTTAPPLSLQLSLLPAACIHLLL